MRSVQNTKQDCFIENIMADFRVNIEYRAWCTGNSMIRLETTLFLRVAIIIFIDAILFERFEKLHQ
jgi:hypothetical protein